MIAKNSYLLQSWSLCCINIEHYLLMVYGSRFWRNSHEHSGGLGLSWALFWQVFMIDFMIFKLIWRWGQKLWKIALKEFVFPCAFIKLKTWSSSYISMFIFLKLIYSLPKTISSHRSKYTQIYLICKKVP